MEAPDLLDRKSTQRAAATQALLNSVPELLDEGDDDWINFLVDELARAYSDVVDAKTLFDAIGEHVTVVSKVIDSPTHPAFEVLYKQLLSAKVLQGPDQASTSEASEPEDVQEDDVEDGAYIEDGCCVMCEREMPLTKHHLIPRETHYWYKKHHGMTHKQLHTGIMVCRECHSAIHSYIDNKTLAAEYNSLEKLLEHPKVRNWIPYISKKRPSSKADKRTWVQHHRTDLPPPDYDGY